MDLSNPDGSLSLEALRWHGLSPAQTSPGPPRTTTRRYPRTTIRMRYGRRMLRHGLALGWRTKWDGEPFPVVTTSKQARGDTMEDIRPIDGNGHVPDEDPRHSNEYLTSQLRELSEQFDAIHAAAVALLGRARQDTGRCTGETLTVERRPADAA